MAKSIEMQRDIKNKAEEFQRSVRDLYAWEKEIKEKELAAKEILENEKIPPVRSKADEMEKFSVEQNTMEKKTEEERMEEEQDAKLEAELLKNKGNKWLKVQNFKEAIECYTKAIKLYRKEPIFYVNRSVCYLNMEQYEKCIIDCDKAINLDPNYVKAYFRRMQAHEYMGNNILAIQDCDQIIKMTKDENDRNKAYKDYDRIKDRLGKELQFDKIPFMKPPLKELKKDEANKYKEEGNNYITLKDFENALVAYTKAIELCDDEAIYYSNRGMCFLYMGDFQNCLNDCNKSIELNVNYLRPYYRRMQAYERLGMLAEALADCEKVIELAEEDKQVLTAKRDYARIYNKMLPSIEVQDKEKLRNIWEDLKRTSKLIDFVQKAPHERSKKPLKRIFIDEVGGQVEDSSPSYVNNDEHIPDSVIDKIFNNNTGENTEEINSKHDSRNLSHLFPSTSSNLKNYFTPTKPNNNEPAAKRPTTMQQPQNKENEKVDKEKINTQMAHLPTGDSLMGTDKVNKEIINAQNFQKQQPNEEGFSTKMLQPPASGSQFVTTWNMLSDQEKYLYLKSVAETPFNQLIGTNLNSDLLSDILRILHNFFVKENCSVLNIMREIAKNSEMPILPLFFEADDKNAFNNLIKYMENQENYQLIREDIECIKNKFIL